MPPPPENRARWGAYTLAAVDILSIVNAICKRAALAAAAGPDLREGKLGSCPGPPQLGGLHKTVKNYYRRKHRNTF